MIYGYIRVNCDKQTVENQRFEINNFCKRERIKIDGWIDCLVKEIMDKIFKELIKFRVAILLLPTCVQLFQYSFVDPH